MKGLLIFVMRPMTDEEMSEYNDYDDERLEKATSTTMKDVMGGSGKRKYHIPTMWDEHEKDIKALVNILVALTNDNSTLTMDDLKWIVTKLQKMMLFCRNTMKRQMIDSMMWKNLCESHRFYLGIGKVKIPVIRAMMSALDADQDFIVMGLSSGLIPSN